MPGASPLPRLLSVWTSGASFLDTYRATDGLGSFFHAAATAAELPAEAVAGALLSVTLRFLHREADIQIHARVLERHESASGPGLRLAFLPEERERQELVVAWASGESVPFLRRRAPRIPCNLPVEARLPSGDRAQGNFLNVSEFGALLAIDRPLEVETTLDLSVAFSPGKRRMALRARVTAVLRGPEGGAGLEFLFSSAEQRAAVASEVARIREALAGA